VRQFGNELIKLLKHPPESPQSAPSLPEIAQSLLTSLKSVIDQLAIEYGLRQSSILATKEDLTLWLHSGKRPEKLTKGWRKYVIQEAQLDTFVKHLHDTAHMLLL
jgi:hypothetical protein